MFSAPVSEIVFTLKHIARFGDLVASGAFPDLSDDLAETVLQEAGRFASEEMAPLDAAGDAHPARLDGDDVTTAPGWPELYRRWREGGWNGVAAPIEFGGQGLPLALSAATQEIWNGASMAFALCPLLNMGAVEALDRHGAPELKSAYLPRLISGEWTATMNLTEPQAGSDVGALSTRAEPAADASYRIFGQKIFITYGEHDFSENIVHLVLARLPGTPAGSRGISLFLGPKKLTDADGRPGRRNDVVCAGLERKLGIHGAPTCTMLYGSGRYGSEAGAVGWLVGEPHRGLAAMFTMMNNARLMIGVQGVGCAERALQLAEAYAAERRQGQAPGWGGGGMSPIAAHPDVRRMLLTMRSLTAASRALCLSCAVAADLAASAVGEAVNADATDWQERAALLTPVAKAFATECGVEVASLGIQVHGGMGYIEDTGAARILRDARIAPIYEGTNGIQAIDLVTRKLPMRGGEAVRAFIREMDDVAGRCRAENRRDFGRMGESVTAALRDFSAATGHLLAVIEAGRMSEGLAGATPYLHLFGLAGGAAMLAKGALASRGDAGAAGTSRIAVARFFAEHLAPASAGLRAAITEGAEAVLGAPEGLLS
jgi:acyl-CoA dehydrogenase